jgi:hypothetical protein
MANDGKMTTSWQAADGDANPRWQLDIEGLYSIESVAISFSESGHYQYKIEASSDGKIWTLLADQTRTASTDKTRIDPCAKNDRSRYLCLFLKELIVGHAPQIEEIKIVGKPSS